MTETERIPFDVAEFERLTNLRGWDNDKKRAAHIGCDQSTISRLRTGEYRPSAKFINRTLSALQVPHGVLFDKDPAPAEVG